MSEMNRRDGRFLERGAGGKERQFPPSHGFGGDRGTEASKRKEEKE